MSLIGRCLGVFLTLTLFMASGPATAAEPVVRAFVTLEKASSGLLKYASTKSDGTFELLDLPNGKYRMSITPPSSDHGADFKHDVMAAFNNIDVKAWGARTQKKAEAAGGELYETGVLLPASLWVQGVIWVDVRVTDRTVSGKFTYVE